MPELPEAETIVRGLRPRVVGSIVSDVDVIHPDVLRSSSEALRGRMCGRAVEGVERRGKNVVLRLDGGAVAVVNLGMTGRLFPLATGESPPSIASHPAVRFRFRGGGQLLFDDVRRFGTVECLGPDEWRSRSEAMGPEPLGRRLTAARFHAALSQSRSPVRSWLLDQRKVAGIGNIYANESLHRARVHPRRPANSLSVEEAGRLYRAIRAVLREAIRAGGTTIRDFRGADGIRGAFVTRLAVYGRDSEPCPRCGEAVRRAFFGGRSAFFCPSCQPAPRENGRVRA